MEAERHCCRQCKAALPEGATFCPKCIAEAGDVRASQQRWRRFTALGMFLTSLVVVLAWWTLLHLDL